MVEVLEGALLGLAVTAILSLVDWLTEKWGRQKMPKSAQVEMSITDQEMILKTQELIQECFGDKMVDQLRNASNIERINMMSDFSKRLAKMYGLDIEVDVTIDNYKKQGAYSWQEQKAVFNIILLTLEGNDAQFEWAVKQSMDTIIHELRHAVQHKAIREPGFWNVEEARRIAWANNVADYITPESDFKSYTKQPIEADASTFAAMVMNEVD